MTFGRQGYLVQLQIGIIKKNVKKSKGWPLNGIITIKLNTGNCIVVFRAMKVMDLFLNFQFNTRLEVRIVATYFSNVTAV